MRLAVLDLLASARGIENGGLLGSVATLIFFLSPPLVVSASLRSILDAGGKT